eukprot:g4596.t1
MDEDTLSPGDAADATKTKEENAEEMMEEMKTLRRMMITSVIACPPQATRVGIMKRFLKAREFDCSATFEMLKKHLEWRKSTFPILKTSFIQDPFYQVGAFQVCGKDRDGRPILVIRSGVFPVSTRSLEACMRGFAAVAEMLVAKHGVDARFTVIYDRTDFSMSENLDKELLKSIGQVAQDNYPELLERCLVYPCPWYLRGLWRIVQYFFAPEVRRKVQFLGSASDIFEYVAPDQLDSSLGGTADFTYNHKAFASSLPDKTVDTWIADVADGEDCDAAKEKVDVGEEPRS